MSIRKLCSAVAALLAAPSAFALDVSADGAGQAVLLPYYSLAGGMSAIVSMTNHADEPKAVRMVIAEGRNGRPALVFNVYLAARDSWYGGLIANSNGGADAPPLLVTNDDSCTSAPIAAGGEPLRSSGYSGSRNDGLGQDMLRLHSGQIEVIDLGTLTGPAKALTEAGDCARLRSRFVSGAWSDNVNADVTAPIGRLSADLHLVDVAAGVAYGIEPFVLENFSSQPRHGRGDTDGNAVRIYKPTGTNAQGRFDVDGVQVDGARPADAVSLLMMAADLEGIYSVEESMDARTHWAVSFPTRPAYLDDLPGGELPAENAPVAPFLGVDTPVGMAYCVSTSWQTIDRDGSLGISRELPLCAQVNTVAVLEGDGPGASADGFEFYTGGLECGRLRVGFHPEESELAYTAGAVPNGARARGLPVLAVPMIEVRNSNAQPGLLASYAITGKVVRRREEIVD